MGMDNGGCGTVDYVSPEWLTVKLDGAHDNMSTWLRTWPGAYVGERVCLWAMEEKDDDAPAVVPGAGDPATPGPLPDGLVPSMFPHHITRDGEATSYPPGTVWMAHATTCECPNCGGACSAPAVTKTSLGAPICERCKWHP